MDALKAIGKSYTTEVLKAALAQSTLSKEHIKAILYANGLRGEVLELTTDEIFNAASTNMVAKEQMKTTGTTLGLGTAFTGLGIKIKEATASLWAFLTTTPAGWATLIIGALAGAAFGIKKYNDYLEETKKKIKETAQEAKSSVDTIKSNFDKLSSTTNEVKKRYAELAQEVENLGKVNQSRGNLNNEEYAEFLNLSNQLAELFPQLTIGYDDNGNAILNLSGNVNTIVGSLNDLIDAQQKLANQEIMKNMPDIWAGYMLDIEGFNKDLKSSEKNVENHLKWAENLRKRSQLTIGNEHDNNLLIEAAKAAGIMSSRYGNDFYTEKHSASEAAARSFISGEWDFSKLTDEEFDKLLNKLEEFGAEYEDTVQIVKGNIASANSGIASYINTWLSTEWNYNKMDSNMQNVIKSMLQSGDWVDLIPDTVDANNWDEVSQWLQEEFLYEINKVQNNEKISKALSEVFTNQDLTPKEKADYIKQIQEYFREDHAITLSLQPQLEETEELEEQYQRAIDFAKKKFKDYDPTAFFNEHSINTQEEIDAWQKIAESVDDATEAEKKYLEQKQKKPVSLSISDTIDQLNTRLKPALDSLQSAYNDIFDDGKFKLNSVDILSTCDSIKSKLDELNKIDGVTVDYSSYEDFVKVLRNSRSEAGDVEKAFDSLATSITQAALSGAEDFETMKAALEDFGVVNSEMVAFGALVSNTNALEEALAQANASMDDFIVNTEDGSVEATKAGQAFLEEKVGAENCAEALSILAFHKELCNLQKMNTDEEVANLKTLAENAGYTGEVIQYLTELEQIYQEVASGTLTKEQILVKTGRATLLKTLIDSAASKINYAPKTDFDGATKSASKSGKEAGDAYVKAFEEELKALEDLRDQGVIDEAEYLCRLRELYTRYFADRKEYLDEFKKYERQYLEGRHTCPLLQ